MRGFFLPEPICPVPHPCRSLIAAKVGQNGTWFSDPKDADGGRTEVQPPFLFQNFLAA
jgi:hypothetical protein